MSEASRRAAEECTHSGRYWRCPACEDKRLADAIARAVEGERERCAHLVETFFKPFPANDTLIDLAAALRAPGEKA